MEIVFYACLPTFPCTNINPLTSVFNLIFFIPHFCTRSYNHIHVYMYTYIRDFVSISQNSDSINTLYFILLIQPHLVDMPLSQMVY